MQKHHGHGSAHPPADSGPRPYWQRAHTDWRFWIGVALMFLAMIVYVLSGDLAWTPRPSAPQAAPAANGK